MQEKNNMVQRKKITPKELIALLSEMGFDKNHNSPTKQQKRVILSTVNNPVTVVSAGAGSGKTHVSITALLVLIRLNLLSIEQVILITFTNKAADELRLRLSNAFRQQAKLLSERCSEKKAEAVKLISGSVVNYSQDAITNLIEEQKELLKQQYFWMEQQELLTGAYIGTIHSFCRSILQQYGYSENVAWGSKVSFAESLQFDAYEKALARFNNESRNLLVSETSYLHDWQVRKLASQIQQACHNQNVGIDVLVEQTANQKPKDSAQKQRQAMAELVKLSEDLYVKAKTEKQSWDAHDLVKKSLSILEPDDSATSEQREQSARVLEQLGKRYKCLFVDEFQDTDLTQYALFSQLIGKMQHTLMVGDGKQAIYAFRGAGANMLDTAHKEHGCGEKPLELSLSGRATKSLLAVQKALFKGISSDERFKKLDEPLDKRGEDRYAWEHPCLEYTDTEETEQQTLNKIQQLLSPKKYRAFDNEDKVGKEHNVEPRDIVVLVRTNAQANLMYDYLSKNLTDVTVRKDSGESIFKAPIIIDTVKVLQCLLHDSEESMLFEFSNTQYAAAVLAKNNPQMLLDLNKKAGSGQVKDWLSETKAYAINGSERAESLYGLLTSLRRNISDKTVPQVLEMLYQKFEIRECLRANEENQAALDLDFLITHARQLVKEDQAMSVSSYVRYLQRMIPSHAEIKDLPVAASSGQDNVLRIMTVHRSKGAEFKFVVVPYMDADINRSPWPQFLVDAEHGLEVELGPRDSSTRSKQYWNRARALHDDVVAEEVRNFYVGITRAELAVYLIGGDDKSSSKDNKESWRTAFDLARTELRGLGEEHVRICKHLAFTD
ncbi:UvrD-helicase domain-containing protein [Vibrio parahaemolyticus]|nr:UvrD-helicase domain-containing protein [Vibrio parahaemolyticus]